MDEDRFEHMVPLSAAACAVLREAASMQQCTRNMHQGDANLHPHGLIFPGAGKNRPIGEGAIGALYARAGFAGRHVPHGWRASFSTILNKEMGRDWRDDINSALAHAEKDKVEAAYNRSLLLDRRREVFNRWGELLVG